MKDVDREALIRERVREIWEAEGRPSGQEQRLRQLAEQYLSQPMPIERAQAPQAVQQDPSRKTPEQR